MLPVRQHGEDDYRKRFEVLERAGVLQRPDRASGTPLVILKPETLKQLSLGFFVAWCLRGVLTEKVRFSFVPLPHHKRTALVVHPATGYLAVPSRSLRVVELDNEYLRCPLDELHPPALPSKEEQVLCPVLNKLRFNLGSGNPGASYRIPRKSEECCDSRKETLWSYVGDTVLTDPDRYGRMFGGTVVPLDVEPALFERYATGLDPDRGDFGKIIDETLLWYAMAKTGCHIGLPNFEFTAPFISHEIDFALYDAGPHKRPTVEPRDGWVTITREQRLCVFETTVGHLTESEISGSNDAPRLVGNDHPKNKLLNFLALNQLGFRRHHFHYLTITGFGKHLSETTRMALKGTPWFEYWSLCEQFTDAEEKLMNHLDTPVPLRTFTDWHDALVGRVETAASTWATP